MVLSIISGLVGLFCLLVIVFKSARRGHVRTLRSILVTSVLGLIFSAWAMDVITGNGTLAAGFYFLISTIISTIALFIGKRVDAILLQELIDKYKMELIFDPDLGQKFLEENIGMFKND